MFFVRIFPLLFLTPSMLGLSQATIAKSNPPKNFKISQVIRADCTGGVSQQFQLGGQVIKPDTFTLDKLKAFPPSQVTVTFQTGQGSETHTYVGVPLWTLIKDGAGGLKPNPEPTVKNGFLRQYIVVSATDCYKAVLAEGEIDPSFEAKQVLVAYATNDPGQGIQPLGDKGVARLVVPCDKKGGRYVSNIRRIDVRSAPY